MELGYAAANTADAALLSGQVQVVAGGDVDPAQIIDNHWVQQLVDSGFVAQLYGR